MASTPYISISTPIPGPRSLEVLSRARAATPRALSIYAPIVASRAHGSLLTDIDGNVFIDLTGGLGVLNVGHTEAGVVEAIRNQAAKLLHTDFTVVPYESYVRLAERLNAKYPGGGPVASMFFNSGAEAVENAVKIARAYTGRPAVVAFDGAFHGRTLMAMSLTSRVYPYKAGMGPFAPEVYRIPYPYPYRCGRAPHGGPHACDQGCLDAIGIALKLQVAPTQVAAIIVEPVQGEGGFVVPPPTFLPWLREFASRYGIVLICDEIQSGFGRTGKFFASEHYGVRPDLITVAKSIADGMPLSAVIGDRKIMDGPHESQLGGTYGGNPVATEAAHAVLNAFESQDLLTSAVVQGNYLQERFRALAATCPNVGDVRGLGAMVGIELVKDHDTKEPAPDLTTRVLATAFANGVICVKAGIFDNVIRFLAPLNTPLSMLVEAVDVIIAAVDKEVRQGS